MLEFSKIINVLLTRGNENLQLKSNIQIPFLKPLKKFSMFF